MTLCLYKFNNYYNRIFKKYDTVEEYSTNGNLLETIEGVTNWNPNDGISTTQIINYQGDIPDYVLVVKDGKIDSRWFVIESKRTRAQQFEIQLYRDVIADWYDDIIGVPCYVEKALLRIEDPFIFNSENMSYNQILTKQDLIKDSTNSAWIVGYLPKGTISEDKLIQVQLPTEGSNSDIITSGLSSWLESNLNITYDFETGKSGLFYPYPSSNTKYFVNWQKSSITSHEKTFFSAKNGEYLSTITEGGAAAIKSVQVPANALSDSYTIVNGFIKNFKNISDLNYVNDSVNYIASKRIGTESQTQFIKNLDNKTIYDQSQQLTYSIKINEVNIGNLTANFTKGSTTFNRINSLCDFNSYSVNNVSITFSNTADNSSYGILYNETCYEIEFIPIYKTIETTLQSNHYTTNDSPYDIFCIPYGEITVYNGSTPVISNTNKEAALQIATAIGTEIGLNTAQFDIQLLPFCPATYAYNNRITADGININNIIFDYIKDDSDTNLNVILWATSSNFTFNVSYNIPQATNSIEKKVQSECDLYRLCSPNYNGVFEFNAAKNNGVSEFQIDCTYKPYNPFIHIRPNFSGLYGINPLKDNRGLICSGDFSLPQITNAFAQYELNNKNYESIFKRNIENMEIKNDVQRIQDIVGIGPNTLSAGLMAGIGGNSLAGPGVGVGAGIVAGAMSLAAGIADYTLNEKLRNEAIDYTKDQFGYQLGNIKAIPNSISKTSALVYNNKLFPFIEYYTCTNEEKDALKNKIKYNGMTVMRIGTISEFINNIEDTNFEYQYFKGKLIRLETISDDFHILNVISNELNKGVYL